MTRAKAGGAEDLALSAEEREAFADWASRMGFATLHRLWQLLLKGHGEVLTAPNPREAAEMALLRVVHAGQLPDPGELAKRLQAGEGIGVVSAALPSPAQAAAPVMVEAPPPALPDTPQALHDLLIEKGAHRLASCFESARIIRFLPPEMMLAEAKGVDAAFARQLQDCLNPKLGEAGPRWQIEVAEGIGKPSLHDEAVVRENAAREAILKMPMVAAVRAAFPDAELIEDSRSVM